MRYKIVREYLAVVTETYVVDDEELNLEPEVLARHAAWSDEGEDSLLILGSLDNETPDHEDTTFDCEESLTVVAL